MTGQQNGIADEVKPINIRWITPNGKIYEDIIPMTIEQYESFVNNLLNLKKQNTILKEGHTA